MKDTSHTGPVQKDLTKVRQSLVDLTAARDYLLLHGDPLVLLPDIAKKIADALDLERRLMKPRSRLARVVVGAVASWALGAWCLLDERVQLLSIVVLDIATTPA